MILALAGCDKVAHKEDPVAEPIFAAIRAQIKALNKRDATAAMAMMHPEAPGLDRTRLTTESVTATFDVLYIIQNLSLESASDNEAKVRFTQIAQKVSGPEFPKGFAAACRTCSREVKPGVDRCPHCGATLDWDFHNNRIVGIHTLRKYQGAWKIYYTQVLQEELLQKSGGNSVEAVERIDEVTITNLRPFLAGNPVNVVPS